MAFDYYCDPTKGTGW